MGWATPTPAELKTSYLTSEEVTAITRAGKATADDPLAGALAQAVARVRGMVAQRTAPDDDPDTVPPELTHETYVLARHTAISRFPALAGMLTEARKTEHSDAMTRLRAVEGGKISVTAAGGDTPVPLTQRAQVVRKSSTRQSGLEGL